MKNKKVLVILQAIGGVLLLLIGSFVLNDVSTKMLSGLCIGFGAAMLVLGIGTFSHSLIVSSIEDEKIKRIKNIEVNDERNVRIKEKTGYMVAKVMNYILIVFIITLGFMNVDKSIIIMACSLIVIELILVIIFSNYFTKKI
ncbi:hypothetical protein ACFIJ5_10160 [Haloimpatiens sp. FM7330]|uniref:hypothetical protein n=1 Tax=Haloimpatiens sp. FM7330 TaxID=3298610 RepID=UPI0036263904